MKKLIETMYDIGRGATLKLDCTPGPNEWDRINWEDFDADGDFRMGYVDELAIFQPKSRAGLQWAYAHLPKDLDRWGATGFVFEKQWADLVIKAAERDKLTEQKE
jgi:hypothetical protein